MTSVAMNNLLAKLIPFLFLGAAAGMVLYLSFRLRIHFDLRPKWAVILGVALLLTGAVVAIIGAVKSPSAIMGGFSVAGGYLLVFSFYLLALLLIAQLLDQVIELPKVVSGWAAVVLALIPTVIGAVKASGFNVNEVTIPMPGLERNLDLMLISDVHLGHHRGGDYLTRIVEATNARDPDIILLAGDLVDSEAALFPGILSPLAGFKAPAYYVSGNHEKAIDEQKAIQLIAANGVHILNDREVDTMGIRLVGLDYMKPDEHTFDMHPSENQRTIKEALGQMRWADGKPVVLMHHSPVGVQYAAQAGVGLMVAGHTHAGQVFPFTLFADLIFDYSKGLHKKENTTVFVSQGAGTFLSRIRSGSENEINLLHLVPER